MSVLNFMVGGLFGVSLGVSLLAVHYDDFFTRILAAVSLTLAVGFLLGVS